MVVHGEGGNMRKVSHATHGGRESQRAREGESERAKERKSESERERDGV